MVLDHIERAAYRVWVKAYYSHHLDCEEVYTGRDHRGMPTPSCIEEATTVASRFRRLRRLALREIQRQGFSKEASDKALKLATDRTRDGLRYDCTVMRITPRMVSR